MKKKEKGFTYTWQDLYCTDDHIKELSLIPPIQYKGTLDVTPLSRYQMDSESDDDSTDTSLLVKDTDTTTAVTTMLTAPSVIIT